MYLAFYVSSHGFGHMTRCLGIIENILNRSSYNIYIVCGKKQNDFAKIYLKKYKHRIIFKDLVTDIGLVNKESSLEVDKDNLQERLLSFTSCWEKIVSEEYDFLSRIDVKYIITDISIIGCLVGNKLSLSVVLISNFTWVEQYEFIGIEESIVEKFRQAYSYVTKLIKYNLFLAMDSINCHQVYDANFLCRKIDYSKVEELRSKYNESIMITCGKSATLKRINIKNFKGTIFTTSGIDIVCNKHCNVINLPVDILDTHNYVAASNLVITKAGWGTIAEAIVGHTNLVLIERPSAREDTFNIEEIKKNKLGISIREEDIIDLDVDNIEKILKENINYDKLHTYKNDVDNVVNTILNI